MPCACAQGVQIDRSALFHQPEQRVDQPLRSEPYVCSQILMFLRTVGRAPRSTAGRVRGVADDDTSIKVSRQTRERLARLAAERRTTLKDVVEELAAATLTAAELAEREQRARSVLAEHFGVEVSDADLAASARLRAMITRKERAA